MKNFKKVVALVLALSLVLSTGTTAFAATENATEGHVLYQLGLMKGTSTTEELLALDDEANAYMAMTLIGRALGWESEATESVFTDVPDYAAPYVAYAVEMKITNGIDATTFGSDVDGARMVTWILRALGYDMTEAYTMTDELAAKAGIVVPTATPVLRDSVAGVIYDTLSATPVDGDMTVIETLIAADATLKDAAVAAGLVAAVPTVPSIASVTATNLKEIIVKFDKEIDTKTVVDANFVVKKGSVSKAIDASLAADKMTVTLKAEGTANFDNQTDYTVTVEKVKDLAGTMMVKEVKTVSVFDASLPEVTEIKVVGPKSLEVTFTEPIKEGGKITIKSGTTSVGVNNNYSTSYGKNVMTVSLFSALKDGTTYTIASEGFKDYAGYTMINNSTAMAYAKDVSAITATVTKATQKYVVVEFSKPVKNLGSAYFYHTFSAWTAKGVYTDEDLTTLITPSSSYSKVYVKFADAATGTDHPLQAGTTNLTILNKVGSTEVKDNWDNLYAGETLVVEVAADVTAPAVSELTVEKENELKIKFDEEVTFTSSNVKVYDEDGKAATVSVSGSAKEYTITLGKSYSGKTLKVEIKDVKDTSLQTNKLVLYTADLSVTDKTAPTVSKVTKKYVTDGEQSLYVFFGEAVDDSALVNANYYLENAGTYKALEDTIEFYDGNKIVKITLKTAEKGYVEAGYNLIVRNVKDTAGNAMIGQTVGTASILEYNAVANAPKIDEVRVIAKDKIEVEFDQLLTTVEANAFRIEGVAGHVAGMEIGTDEDGNTIVTLTVDTSATGMNATIAADISNATDFTVDTTAAVDTNLANVFGVAAATETKEPTVDKMAPSVVTDGYTTVDADGNGKIDHIKVDFDENLYVATIAMDKFTVAGYDVKDAYLDSVAAPGASATVRAVAGGDASVVWVTVKEKDTTDGGTTPTVSIATGIKDDSAAKNAFEAVSDKDTKDMVAPVSTVVTATYTAATNTIVITGTGFEDTFDATKVTYTDDAANVKTLGASTVTVNSATQVTIVCSAADASAIEGLANYGGVDDVLAIAANYLTDGNANVGGTAKADVAVTIN